ncbi:MAG TPA: head GIN domain-containing protein [Flavobacteriaceae bacterium]|nr:head GIN domain-containing protein [Flavobacteriaceae bacterium]
MTTLVKIIVTSVLSLLLFSCNLSFSNSLDGKGAVTLQEHDLETFNQIDVSKGWDVVLIKSDKSKMTVETNENLHENLEFTVENEILSISGKENIGNAEAKSIKVYYAEKLQKIGAHSGSEIVSNEVFQQDKIKIDASSGADISLKVDTKNITVNASSGAEIELFGTTENLESNASSGASIEAKNLDASSAVAEASSGANVELKVSESLTAGASSGGNVVYHGNPKNTSIDNSVSGDVSKR